MNGGSNEPKFPPARFLHSLLGNSNNNHNHHANFKVETHSNNDIPVSDHPNDFSHSVSPFQAMFSSLDYTHLIAFVFGLWMAVSCWQASSKKFSKRRMRSRINTNKINSNSSSNGSGPMTNEQYQARLEQQREEYDSLVSALREELHEKSIAENEQAILWRQEKNILRARIEEVQQCQPPQASTADLAARAVGSTDKLQQEILAKITGLEQTVAFLTNLSETQNKELESKQNELDRLQNVLSEMSVSMDMALPKKSRRKSSKGSGHSKKKQTRKSHIQLHPDSVQRELEEQLSLRFSHNENNGKDDSDEESALSGDDNDDDEESSDEISELAATTTNSRLSGDNKIVLLTSSMPGNLQVSTHQSRIESIFRQGLHLGNSELEIIDGCNTEVSSLRNDLFAISGLHAVYPQVFLVANGDIQFIGDYDTVVELHDTRALPGRIGLILADGESVEDYSESSTLPSSVSLNAKYGSLLNTSSRQSLVEAASPRSPE